MTKELKCVHFSNYSPMAHAYERDAEAIDRLNRLKRECAQIDCEWQKIPEKSRAVDDETRKLEIMNLLHRYNDVKDATQVICGALANIDRVTVREVHKRLNLPME